MNNRHCINLQIKKLWVEIGWFPGEPFKLFCITVCETLEYKNNIDYITLLSIQLAYAAIGCGWNNNE